LLQQCLILETTSCISKTFLQSSRRTFFSCLFFPHWNAKPLLQG